MTRLLTTVRLLVRPRPDRELLLAYATRRDEAAFAELVRRHAGMVHGIAAAVCPAEADDVAQATFALLARRAATLAPRESPVGWLFETARRLAHKARTAAARRTNRQARATPPRPPADPLDDLTFAEVRAIVADQLARLPERLRVPLVLCYWEGITAAAAADRLGCSVSSVKRRLSDGRDQLAAPLARCGFTASAALAALTGLQATASAAAPAALVAALTAQTLSPGAAALVRGAAAPAVKYALAGVVMLALGSGLVLGIGSKAGSVPPALSPKLVAAPPFPRTDAFGDPLPPGALVRFGTTRFRHGGQLHAVAYSPDGKTLASGGYGRVMLWEASSGKPIAPLVRTVNDPRNKMPEPLMMGHTFGLAFTPDGRSLLSAGAPPAEDRRGHVLFWDINDRKCAHAIDHAAPQGTQWMRTVAVSPDGCLAAAGTDSGHLLLIDTATRKTVRTAKVEGVAGLSFSPDGKTLAVATMAAAILFDVSAGKETWRFDTGRGTRQVVFAPDGKSIWVGRDGGGPPFRKDSRPGVLARWDFASGKQVQAFEVAPNAILSLALSPDGKTLACGGDFFGPLVIDVATGKSTDLGLAGARNRPWVQGLAFAPDGKALAVADTNGRVRVWDVATRRELHRYNSHTSGVLQVALSPDQKHAATAAGDGFVRVWEVSTGRPIRSWTADEKRSVFAVNYTPDGRHLLTSGWDGSVRLWEAETGKEVRRFSAGGEAARSASSTDGKLVAASGKDGRSIVLYEAATGHVVRECTGHVSHIMSLAFSPDGRQLVSTADMHSEDGKHFDDSSVRVWDVSTGKQLHKFEAGRPAGNVAISPDGRVVAAVVEGDLRLWDAVTGKELTGRRVKGVTAFAFSPDGRHLAIASQGIRLVEVASGGVVHTLDSGPAEVSCLTFAPGNRLLSAHYDGTTLVWDLSTPLPTGATTVKLWGDLASTDAALAHRAAQAMVAAPAAAMTVLGEKLEPVPKPAAARSTAALIADLDDEKFAVREAASRELIRRVGVADAEMTQALAGSPSGEVQQRLRRILRSSPGPWPKLDAEDLRRVRAVAVLESIGTTEARRLLTALADGDPHALLTCEARKACDR